jgi:rare lipoprotein A
MGKFPPWRPLAALLLPALLVLAACAPKPPADPHYQLGAPYQAGGVWYYPRENFSASETGLAAVAPDSHPPLTANGEAYDPTAMAAGHQTMQLPAIARVTNLETGRQLVLRINDRGPASPARLLELTPRAAQLLGVPPAGGSQIRVDILPAESRAAIEGLRGTPTLAIAAAPRGAVRQESLDAPAPDAAPTEAATVPDAPAVPRLPEAVLQTPPNPGTLAIRLGSFGRREFAETQRARLARFAPILETEREGRQTVYRLRISPLRDVAAADSTLAQVIRAGVTDARIVVEE